MHRFYFCHLILRQFSGHVQNEEEYQIFELFQALSISNEAVVLQVTVVKMLPNYSQSHTLHVKRRTCYPEPESNPRLPGY